MSTTIIVGTPEAIHRTVSIIIKWTQSCYIQKTEEEEGKGNTFQMKKLYLFPHGMHPNLREQVNLQKILLSRKNMLLCLSMAVQCLYPKFRAEQQLKENIQVKTKG